MPGVLQIEALAQAAGILGIETMELAGTGKLVIFMGIENAKFRSPVTPGCLLDLEVEQKHGRIIYELEILRDDGIVYEIKIDAKTGEWLKEKVD